MTLTQLRYVVEVAGAKTISKAAENLYISQPSLTSAIKDLEHDLGIQIFQRTNKGVILTSEGEEFLGYARQIIHQTSLVEERYAGRPSMRHQFCVSCQHYPFAVEAFVSLLKEVGGDTYDFRIRETQTFEIIQDVSKLKSDLGILYINSFNESVLAKMFKEHHLHFETLCILKPHIVVKKEHPLAKCDVVHVSDLSAYPRLSYEQGAHDAFYYSEEILSTLECQKDIRVCDRATLYTLLDELDGYTICGGLFRQKKLWPQMVSVPLHVDDFIQVGILTHKQTTPGYFVKCYIDALKRFVIA